MASARGSWADQVGQKHERGDVEARLVGDLAVDFAPAVDTTTALRPALVGAPAASRHRGSRCSFGSRSGRDRRRPLRAC